MRSASLACPEEEPVTTIEKLRVRGYRSIREASVEFGRVTVLIGPNGAGKSNLLSALALLPMVRTQSLNRRSLQVGAAAMLHYGPKATAKIEFELELDAEGVAHQHELDLVRANDDTLFIGREWVRGPEDEETVGVVALPTGRESALKGSAATDPRVKVVADAVGSMSFFHFHDTSVNSELRTPARREDARYLRSNGSNLPAFLLALSDSEESADEKAWRRINRHLRQIAPSLKALSPRADGQQVHLEWVDARDEIFGVHHLSDGTLRALALITALCQPPARLPGFISLDEPELGLHPAAIALLARLVRAASARAQLVVATQSTELLDHFEAVEVVITEWVDGQTGFRRLSATDLSEWLDRYTLSELYNKNLLGGRP